MKTGPFALLCIALLSAGCGKVPILRKATAGDDLPRRVSRARIVLVGKLVTLNERAVSDQEQEFVDGRLHPRVVWYDVASIEVVEILKGTCDSSKVVVKFPSFDQTQFPPRDKADCHFFSYHDIWNPGIWLIDIDRGEPRFTVQRGNYEPMTRLEDVKTALSKSAKALGEGK